MLQHPHSTDSHRIWRMPWSGLVKDTPSIKSWGSGIGYHNWDKAPRMELERVLQFTKSDDVRDIVIRPS